MTVESSSVGMKPVLLSAIHGFAFMNGRYVTIDYPGAVLTSALGINATGQMVGEYQFADHIDHGFVTSPITAADFKHSGCCQTVTDETRH